MCSTTRLFIALIGILLSGLTLPPAQAQVTGWRGDGSGRFTKAQPPTKWSKDSENILWKTDLPKGYSSPILNDGRLFLTAQPSEVICIDAAKGTELWRQTADYTTTLGAAEAARIAATQGKLATEKAEINKKYKDLQKVQPDSPELERLNDQRKEVDNRRRDFERQFPSEKRGGAGNAAATVLCDGKRVFALFGTGILAAFQVDGQPLWSRHLEAPQQNFGHSASPVIAGGNLIVHIQQLTALEPETGKTIWRTDVPAKFGTPAVTQLGGNDIIVTASGSLVDATDGRLLAEKQFQLSHNSPLVHDGIIYAHEGGKIKALRIPTSLQTPFDLELLWETSGTRDQRMASAIYHQNLLYAATRRGIIEATDAETGKTIYRKRTDIGEIFSSPILAGNMIYYAGKNGETLVLGAGRQYHEVATNQSDQVSSIPFFDGKRMYLRTDKSLYCIEAK